MSRREEIISTIKSVPAISATAVQVSRMLQDPEVKTKDLQRAIEYDPGLAANVLRLANSAYFGGPYEVKSIRQGIVRLGVNCIYHMVMASAVSPVAQRPVRGYALSVGQLWEHSVSVAVGTEAYAEKLKKKPPEYAFTAGLLHDIGKIVLGTFVEVDAKPIMELALEDGLSFEVAEQKVLGIDHAEVGALLLEGWNLPREIVDVVRWHHQPDEFPGGKLVVDLVHAADVLSMMGGLGTGSDGLHYRVSREVTERLGLNIHLAEAVACRVLGDLDELRSQFALNTGR